MSEQEEIDLRAKINQGLKQSYESLLRRKAALGQDMVIADANGQPVVVPAKELLARRTETNGLPPLHPAILKAIDLCRS